VEPQNIGLFLDVSPLKGCILRFCVSFRGCRNPQHPFFKWFSLIANLANSEFLSRTLRHPVFRSSVKCKAVTKAGQSFVEITLKLAFQVFSDPKLSRHMRQWFKLERAYEMMEAYEEEHEDFDLVLKLRNGTTMGKTALQGLVVALVVCWRENFMKKTMRR